METSSDTEMFSTSLANTSAGSNAQIGMTSTTRATSLPCCGTLAQTAAP